MTPIIRKEGKRVPFTQATTRKLRRSTVCIPLHFHDAVSRDYCIALKFGVFFYTLPPVPLGRRELMTIVWTNVTDWPPILQSISLRRAANQHVKTPAFSKTCNSLLWKS